MENKKIYILSYSQGEYDDRIEINLAASFNKETLEKMQFDLENKSSVISEEKWKFLRDQFVKLQEEKDSDDLWDMYTSDGIYEYITQDYTREELEEAEELYEFQYDKKYYYIEEIDYYELKITKK